MRGQVHIIGTGGVGSWLAASLSKLIEPAHVNPGPPRLFLHDGDIVEAKNLDRQFFMPADIGKNKAEALALRVGGVAVPGYFSSHTGDYTRHDWLICCADNNSARRACLDDADRCNLRTIIAANEKTSAEAYYFDAVEGSLTPRPDEYYPEIMVDDHLDPRAIKIGCVGEAQIATPQLVSANFMAAALAQWLFVLWTKVDDEPGVNYENLPYRLRANISRLETHLIRDYVKEQPKEENANTNATS